MGGNRKDFWDLWKKEKVGLITFEESEVDQIEGIGEKDIAHDIALASYPSTNLTDNSSLLVNLSDVGFHTNISRVEIMKYPVLAFLPRLVHFRLCIPPMRREPTGCYGILPAG